MKISAMEGEVGGRAEVAAKKVYVGNHAGQDDRDCGATGGAREGSALNRIRGQGVGERVHTGEVISQKQSLSRRFRCAIQTVLVAGKQPRSRCKVRFRCPM